MSLATGSERRTFGGFINKDAVNGMTPACWVLANHGGYFVITGVTFTLALRVDLTGGTVGAIVLCDSADAIDHSKTILPLTLIYSATQGAGTVAQTAFVRFEQPYVAAAIDSDVYLYWAGATTGGPLDYKGYLFGYEMVP